MDFERILVVETDIGESVFEFVDPAVDLLGSRGVDAGNVRDFPFAVRPGFDFKADVVAVAESGVAVEFGEVEGFEKHGHGPGESAAVADGVVVLL